jgi:hypothetical protein
MSDHPTEADDLTQPPDIVRDKWTEADDLSNLADDLGGVLTLPQRKTVLAAAAHIRELGNERDLSAAEAGEVIIDFKAEVASLTTTIEQAVQELDDEHHPMWSAKGVAGYSTEPRDDLDPVGCVTCYPSNSDWPCVSRMIADDLRKKIEPKQKEQ